MKSLQIWTYNLLPLFHIRLRFTLLATSEGALRHRFLILLLAAPKSTLGHCLLILLLAAPKYTIRHHFKTYISHHSIILHNKHPPFVCLIVHNSNITLRA